MKCLFLFTCFFLFSTCRLYAQVENTQAAFEQLEIKRNDLRAQLKDAGPLTKKELLKKGLQLGMWEEISTILKKDNKLLPNDKLTLLARYLWLNNNFNKAHNIINQVLKTESTNLEAAKIKATLLIEAWKLEEAVTLCQSLLKQSADSETALILGKALLLQRKYDQAYKIAKDLQADKPNLAGAYLLEADVYFWNQQPDKATPLIVKSLKLDPFNADARFSYGYAIWRRVDATKLDQMAAQWELALALNPLHFQTHWHWGNGHTNLTFVDYADPDESLIRKELAVADSLVRKNKLDKALSITHSIAAEFPQSVLPLMHRASIYYSDFDNPQRKENLDSAQLIFQQILQKKRHYGPAHNGLSAVIKSKRTPYLSTYDSIKTNLRQLKITDFKSFETVFPDVAYYPGDLAKAMVWNQLYTSIVYFPFLIKQGNTFVIPPLHEDLAIAMKRPFFRASSTFDNRQWMDIRGVGSGAAAIEYVERGAYQERNVILHEYVHLFHGRVLSDQENRRIRALYYLAMQRNRTLDYYSQNNESEYFAQTYPAYFETVKVHPLDFKSMNTQSALMNKDPDMYHFLDSLVKKEKRYLAGDRKAMASNWAQVYINMSKQTNDKIHATRLLDTALQFDHRYQPAYLAYADIMMQQKSWQTAYTYIRRAEKIDSTYAPVYEAYAKLDAQQTNNLTADKQLAHIQKQVDLLTKAAQLERDYQNQASIASALRMLYYQQGKAGLAIKAAADYIQRGSELSTYLRDKKDEARAFSALQRTLLGDTSQLILLKRIIEQKPQNFAFQLAYAEALSSQGLFKASNQQLRKVQQLLASNGSRRSDFDLLLASNYFSLNQVDSTSFYLKLAMDKESTLTSTDRQCVAQLLIHLGHLNVATDWLKNTKNPVSPYDRSLYFYSEALLKEKQGKMDAAIDFYKQSLHFNPYLKKSFNGLLAIYKQQGRKKSMEELIKQHNSLFVP